MKINRKIENILSVAFCVLAIVPIVICMLNYVAGRKNNIAILFFIVIFSAIELYFTSKTQNE